MYIESSTTDAIGYWEDPYLNFKISTGYQSVIRGGGLVRGAVRVTQAVADSHAGDVAAGAGGGGGGVCAGAARRVTADAAEVSESVSQALAGAEGIKPVREAQIDVDLFGLPIPVHFQARGVVHEQFAASGTLRQRELRLVRASSRSHGWIAAAYRQSSAIGNWGNPLTLSVLPELAGHRCTNPRGKECDRCGLRDSDWFAIPLLCLILRTLVASSLLCLSDP